MSLSWKDWPARRQPGTAMAAALLVVATVGAVASLDRWLAVLAALLLLTATGEVLLPTRYEVDAEGVRLRGALRARRLRWSQLAGWEVVGADVVLRGDGPHPLLRRRRTVVLRATPPELDDMLRRHLGDAG